MPDVAAKVRTILGDDPNTIEDDTPATLVEGLRAGIIGVEVAGMGTLLFVPDDDKGPDRAAFVTGPGREERFVDVLRTADDRVECTIIANSRGQRRMVVVIEGVPGI